MAGPRIVLDRPLDLSALPAAHTARGSSAGWVFILFAFVLLGILVVALGRLPAEERTVAALATFVVLLGIGLAVLVGGVASLRRRDTLTVDRQQVVREREGLFGAHRRAWPLSEFSGISRKQVLVSTSSNGGARAVCQVALEHPEDSARVALYATADESRARNYQMEAARALGLPLVMQGSDGTVRTVSPDEVDAPLVERARAGALESVAPDLTAIPPDLDVTVDGDRIDVTNIRRLVKIGHVLGLAVLAAGLIAARPVLGAPGIVTGLGGLVAFVAITIVVLDRIADGCLVLARDRVETFWRLRVGSHGTFQHKSLAIDDVRDARLRRDVQKRLQLAIEGHAAVLEFGNGLEAETLEWVRALVIQNARRAADSAKTPPVSPRDVVGAR